VDRYSFDVRLFHSLLLAGLSRRTKRAASAQQLLTAPQESLRESAAAAEADEAITKLASNA
jgi:ribosomal protein L13E